MYMYICICICICIYIQHINIGVRLLTGLTWTRRLGAVVRHLYSTAVAPVRWPVLSGSRVPGSLTLFSNSSGPLAFTHGPAAAPRQCAYSNQREPQGATAPTRAPFPPRRSMGSVVGTVRFSVADSSFAALAVRGAADVLPRVRLTISTDCAAGAGTAA